MHFQTPVVYLYFLKNCIFKSLEGKKNFFWVPPPPMTGVTRADLIMPLAMIYFVLNNMGIICLPIRIQYH